MTIYKTFKKILEEKEKELKREREKEREKINTEIRKELASKDNIYTFKANFDAVEDINWDMFKNE